MQPLISPLNLTLSFCGILAITACQKNDPLPNILVLTADDLAYNSVGAFGCQVNGITPNIDRLATQGIRFAYAHTNVAVCQPCRQSVMTGLYPHNNGAEGFEPIDEDVRTLQEYLKELGYLNGILGKEIHHQPREKFFWDFMPFVSDPDSAWRKSASRNPSMFYSYASRFFSMAKEKQKPFFLLANSHDPHRPFVGSRLDSTSWGDHVPPVTRTFHPDEIHMLGYLPDIRPVRREVAQYYGSVYRCDQSIGAVLDALDESGLQDNTLVIFFSDHGAAFPFSKSQCYLNSTKTPLIIRWPGKIKQGVMDEEHFVTGIDFMPTILDIVGIQIPEGLDGRSFAPLLKQQKQSGREYAYTVYYQIFARTRYPMRCVQDENYGYIFNFWSDHNLGMTGDATGGITWRAMVEAAQSDSAIARRVDLYKYRVPEEFYDVRNDPDALVNLINDPAYAEVIDVFRNQMVEMMRLYHDPALEAFNKRHDPDALRQFMDEQREMAKKTKAVEKF